jgi:hypothetical protein
VPAAVPCTRSSDGLPRAAAASPSGESPSRARSDVTSAASSGVAIATVINRLSFLLLMPRGCRRTVRGPLLRTNGSTTRRPLSL